MNDNTNGYESLMMNMNWKSEDFSVKDVLLEIKRLMRRSLFY